MCRTGSVITEKGKKMLILPIKEPWFSMIRSGEKKEEYREIKDYYRTRFANQLPSIEKKLLLDEWLLTPIQYEFDVLFRNGYSGKSPSFVAHCRLSIGHGKEEWGAEKGKQYYVLTILERREDEN